MLMDGPFHDRGMTTAPRHGAFDAHLRSLDPAMGVRDAVHLLAESRTLRLDAVAEVAMPASNRLLILRGGPEAQGSGAGRMQRGTPESPLSRQLPSKDLAWPVKIREGHLPQGRDLSILAEAKVFPLPTPSHGTPLNAES